MITCIALDDEPKALRIVEAHISRVEELHLLQSFTDPFKAISYLSKQAVDCIFLDIKMPDMDALSFLKSLKKAPLVIFTTAHQEFALESYNYAAVDYLLKPFDFPRFMSAIHKLSERLDKKKEKASFFFVNTGSKKERIVYDELLYIEADGNYVFYICQDKKCLVRSSIKEALENLSHENFIQLHRSYIVNLGHIDKIETYHVSIGVEKIPISASFKEAFLKRVTS